MSKLKVLGSNILYPTVFSALFSLFLLQIFPVSVSDGKVFISFSRNVC